MKVLEKQTYWSTAENKVVVIERLLNLEFLGEKNNIQFYNIFSSDASSNIEGELTINFENLTIAYSKQINTEFKKDIIFLSELNYNKNDNKWQGFSFKVDIPENNYCELSFIE
jgi:hypothetical protein